MEEAKGGGGGGTAYFQVVGPGTSLMSMDTSPGGVTINHELESEALLALADMDTQPIPGRKRFRPGPEETSTPIKVKDPPEKSEENNDKENFPKKLASDADYSTPKRVKSESTSGIYFAGAIVKRRLNFDAVALMEGDTSSGDSWTTSSKTVEEEEEEEDRHLRHNKKKKRRRHHHHHVSSKVVQVIGQDGEPVRKIIASKSGSSTEINQGEGTEGKKEEETASKEESKCQGPPRRIAQLVVWTKPKEISGEVKEGKKELAPGGKKKAGSKIKEPPKEAEQVCAVSTTSGLEVSSGVVEGSSGQVEKEGDLFFVQYPARPFSDQGKGRGKPFRRLNSYNDPIVIKKTPPPPPPSQPKRRKVGEKRKRVGKKSKETVVTVENNLGFLEQHQAAYRAYLEQAYPQQQQQEYNLAQLWPPPQPQQGGTEGQPQFVQEYYQCTLPLQGELGEVITLPLQVPQEQGGTVEVIVPAEFTIQPQPQQQPQVLEEHSVDKKEEGNGIMGEGSGQSSAGEGTVFELPERFTVTTEGQNEFDLLIQNVVHEELVNGGGLSSTEEELGERGRKRMRLEDGGGDEEAVSSGGEERVASGGGNGNGSEEEGKPRCTYTELIEKALTESGGLTVSEIYNWISERYPYYKQDDDRWKNSVRHNLSINPYFKKGEKARSGAGHLWTISEESKALRPSMVSGSWDERRKSPCDPGELLLSMDNETDRAVANILGMYRSKMEAEKGGGSKENEEDFLEEPAAPPEKPVVVQEQTPTTDSYCVTTTTSAATSQPVASSMITLNQLNTGQFTVDLSGITIPDGGTINFDELVSNGRLIYIETSSTSATNQDPEANKENEQHQSSLLHHHTDSLLSELASGGGQNGPVVTGSGAGGPVLGEEEANNLNRFGGSYFQDLDFGSASVSNGKGDHHGALQHHFEEFATSSSSAVGMVTTLTNSGLTMVPPSEVVPVSSSSGGSAQDYGILESLTGAGGESTFSGEFLAGSTSEANYHHLPPSGITAAMYESKELGIPYTFQTEGLQQPQQQQHLHHNQHSHLLQHPDLLQ